MPAPRNHLAYAGCEKGERPAKFTAECKYWNVDEQIDMPILNEEPLEN